MEVRPLKVDEHDAAGRATAEAYRELVPDGASGWDDYLSRVTDVGLRAGHALVFVAVEDGDPLGTVTLEVEGRIPGGHERPPLRPGEAHIRMLGVRPDARRRGVARALVERAIAEAQSRGSRS